MDNLEINYICCYRVHTINSRMLFWNFLDFLIYFSNFFLTGIINVQAPKGNSSRKSNLKRLHHNLLEYIVRLFQFSNSCIIKIARIMCMSEFNIFWQTKVSFVIIFSLFAKMVPCFECSFFFFLPYVD